MVYSGETGGRRVREFVMAMEPERSKPPLHNFNLPCLKWGNQRYLRCMKVSDSATAKDKNIISNGVSVDRLRSSRSPFYKFVPTRYYENCRFKTPKSRNDNGSCLEEGIAEVREKLMFDFKAAADKMKDAILRKGVSEDGEEEEEEEEVDEKVQSSRRAPPAAAAVDTEQEQEVRPWNLRTRRAACKAPITGNSVREKGGLKNEENNYSPLRTDSAKSPRLRGVKKDREDEKEKDTEQVRTKFAVPLSRKEIEEDFMEMVGHRPARRPKKRPRTVQRQLDSLFPGLWLTEVTVDTYKVPEFPDNGKR